MPTTPLESLVAAHVDLVYAAALRQVRDPHLADDVTQAVFLLLARRWKRTPDDSLPVPTALLAPWLLTVTRYTALTTVRASRRRTRYESAAPPTQRAAETPLDPLLADLVDEALMALGEQDRRLIILRYLQERPLSEIASALHLQKNTVAKRTERALKKMRGFLENRGLRAQDSDLAVALAALAKVPTPPKLVATILSTVASPLPAMAHFNIPLGVLIMTAGIKAKVALLVLATGLLLVGIYEASRGLSRTPQTPVASILPTPASVISMADVHTTLSGVVTDAAGKPVAGAMVTQGDSPWDEEFVRTRTDEQGRFELPGVRVGADLTLAAQAPGLAPALITGKVTEEAAPFSLSLQPGNTIRMQLVDARGKPLPNLQVEPMLWRNTEALRRRGRTRPEFTTDNDGVITWHEAPADEVQFDAVVSRAFLDKPFRVRPSNELQTITIRDAVPVVIKVVDDATGLPVEHFSLASGWAEIGASEEHFDSSIPPATDVPHGALTTSIVRHAPRHLFRVEAPGYAQAVQSVNEDQENVHLEFRLRKTAGAQLTVLLPDGTPAAKETIYVTPRSELFRLDEMKPFHRVGGSLSAHQRAYITDELGKATIVDPPDLQLQVVVSNEAGFASAPLSEAAKRPLRLDAWARLDGQVFIGAHPVANQRITANYGPASSLEAFVHGSFAATTDADGRFVIDRVPPRRLNIGRDIEMDDMGTTTANAMVSPNPGETVHITLGGKGRPVVGTIIGADGKPLSGIVYFMGSLQSPPRPTMLPALVARITALRNLPAEDAQKKYAELRPEIDSFNEQFDAWRKKSIQNAFALQHNGTFRADDIEAGMWELNLRIQSKSGDASAIVHATFTVPPIPGESSDEPLDIGTITAPALLPLRKP